MTAPCTCTGPVDAGGWSPQCPVHTVRSMLALPMPVDPAALARKLVALGLELTDDNTIDVIGDHDDPR